MKKIVLLITFFISTNIAFSQGIVRGGDILDGKLTNGYSLLLKIDNKILENEWASYTDLHGKTKELDKHRFSLTQLKNEAAEIATGDFSIESKVVEFKDFTKIFCTVEGANSAKINEEAMLNFLADFKDQAEASELKRLAEQDLEEAEKYLSDQEKTQKKIERSMESNLKAQEKYGKVLDDSPDKMVALLDEKRSIVDNQLTDSLSLEETKELEKAASKKEREISKNKKNEVKYNKKLQAKEDDFEELKNELYDAKDAVTTATALVMVKKKALEELK